MGVFDPINIGSLALKNRFVRSATFDGTADESGAVTDQSVALYRDLGHGGVGLIVSGYMFVSSHGQALPGQYGVHTDYMIPGLKRMVDAAHEGGARIAIQIVHAGNNSGYLAGKGIEALAPSHKPGWQFPHREMTGEEVEGIISDFAVAARRAVQAGFDAVQLHGAHGYLMSQFQSPIFNQRSDQWGGSPENRRRFHLRTIEAVRREVGPDYPLMIKYGAWDDREDGLSLDEGSETAREMAEKGIEAIEVSSGVGTSIQVVKRGEPEKAYFREMAAFVERTVSVPVMAVGGIRSLDIASSILESGDADFVSMCRPFIREPDLVGRWQRGDTRPSTCISCNKCLGVARTSEPLRCIEDYPQA